MGDLGYLDEAGTDLVLRPQVAPGGDPRTGPSSPSRAKAVFNTHPDVFRTALVGVGARRDSSVPVLCVELEKGTRSRPGRKCSRELLAIGSAHSPHPRDHATILFHPAFPVDIRHNAKIFREKLARWAAGRLA